MEKLDLHTYKTLETYMLACMDDSAHDKEHIYRVLYAALDIADHEKNVDYDALICACLLHDIGRREELENPGLCHAAVGAEKAYSFLTAQGFAPEFAGKVKDCIKAHRFRSPVPPQCIEAKILFDADKIDVTGAIGVARTLFYNAQVSEPLYTMTPDGQVSDGSGDAPPSFFQEYKYKLEDLYNLFYTARGVQIASERKAAAKAFYDSLLREARSSYGLGRDLLDRHIN